MTYNLDAPIRTPFEVFDKKGNSIGFIYIDKFRPWVEYFNQLNTLISESSDSTEANSYSSLPNTQQREITESIETHIHQETKEEYNSQVVINQNQEEQIILQNIINPDNSEITNSNQHIAAVASKLQEIESILDYVPLMSPTDNRPYGEMYAYENTTAIVVPKANTYQPVAGSGIVTGTCSGFTFTAGVVGAIASVADYSGTVTGTILITVTAGHNLTTGDRIGIYNTTNYDGKYQVTVVSPTTFYVTKAYVSDQTGSYARGARLRAEKGNSGIYRICMSMTAISASANKIIKFEMNKNATDLDNIVVSRAFDNTDYTPMFSSGFAAISAGDDIWISLRNETSATNVTVRHCNVSITKA